jgi:molybdopterin-guanine dinucleotide biosynthesis protein A
VAGVRIIDRIADALRQATSDIVIVAGAPGAVNWIPGARVIPDAWSTGGSLVGIHAALTYAREPILVVAWDMPFVTTPLFELLLSRAERSPYATLPEGPSGVEPFCAVYSPACLPIIEAGLAADDLKLAHMLARLPSYERVPLADVARIGDPHKLFFNVNTMDDLATAERLAT